MIDQPYRADEENLRALARRYELELGKAEARLAKKTAPARPYVACSASAVVAVSLITYATGGMAIVAGAIAAACMAFVYFLVRFLVAMSDSSQ